MRATVLDEEGTDPAALEADRLAYADQVQLYRVIVWTAVVATMIGWGWFLIWVGQHLRGWMR